MIELAPGVEIPESELRYVASRSGGPGGQNVNKVSSRITLLFELDSSSLGEEVKEKIRARLASRISRDGVLQVSSQRFREQGMNRQAALEKFVDLVRDALTDAKPRRKTRVPAAVRRKRLDEKRQRSRLKAERRGPPE